MGPPAGLARHVAGARGAASGSRRPEISGEVAVGGGEQPHEAAREVEEVEELEALRARRSAEPRRVSLGSLREQPRKLDTEQKLLTDLVKMAAYRTESTLGALLHPFYARCDDEAHKLLKTAYETPADLVPDEAAGTLLVRFHGVSNRRSNRALQALCDTMTSTETTFPGTALRLCYQVTGGDAA
jgi:hypothetical protein